MFTGIVEATSKIVSVTKYLNNKDFVFESNLAKELYVDQSIAHNGVCLTVTECNENTYKVTAIEETLLKTNLNDWQIGNEINIERCIKLSDRVDGHIVQGHVDEVGKCINKKMKQGSWQFTISFNPTQDNLIVEKGSVCVNGVSLTAFNVGNKSFDVAIIPYTFQHTNFQYLEESQKVNIEFDIIGKYIAKLAKDRV